MTHTRTPRPPRTEPTDPDMPIERLCAPLSARALPRCALLQTNGQPMTLDEATAAARRASTARVSRPRRGHT